MLLLIWLGNSNTQYLTDGYVRNQCLWWFGTCYATLNMQVAEKIMNHREHKSPIFIGELSESCWVHYVNNRITALNYPPPPHSSGICILNISLFSFVDKTSLKTFMNKSTVFCILTFEMKNERRIRRNLFYENRVTYYIFLHIAQKENIFWKFAGNLYV